VTAFGVWAPGRRRVDLVLDDGRRPMEGRPDGWWEVTVDDAGPGTRYRFSLDDGPPRPDPRSRWQPDGVDGPSAVDDPAGAEWSDTAWHGRPLASSVLYELHVGTFSPEGTFDGVVEHLDHLVELGVDAIELLPVAEFAGRRGWGYDGVLLWAPHHAYGGPAGLRRLVDAAHRRGLAVVLDVVYNHLGPAGNHLGEFGPYFTDRYQTPWGQAVNFDGEDSDEVRRFVIDNACMWLEDYHLDGLRLDAVHAIVDESALHLLEEMAGAVERLSGRLGRTLWLIAESDRNDPRLVAPVAAGGYGLDATWSDDFHHALHAALTGERSGYYADFGTLAQLARAYRHVYVYGRHRSPSRRRHHGRPVSESTPGTRFLGYLQNHDQIGNRAVGERSAALLSPGRVRVGAALVLLAPFVPMLFMGEEWGASTPWQYFTDHEAELGRAVSEGRRREFAAFGWSPDEVPDPQDPATRDRAVLRWDEADREPHASLLAWHRALIALRRRVPDLGGGDRGAVSVDFDEAEQWLSIQRGATRIVVNLAARAQRVPVGPGQPSLLLASAPAALSAGGGVMLPPESVAVLRER